jgi:membrane fusion protein (multidrug efflux system)
MNAQSPTKAETVVDAPTAKPRRRRWGLIVSLPLVLLAGGAVYWVNGGRVETTENANLHQARINIASDLGGRVVAVSVADGKMVTKGTVMFTVDPEPYRLALLQADTAVAAARLQVTQLKGAHAAAVVQYTVAADDAKFQTDELNRQIALSGKGVGTTTQLDAARNTARRAAEQASLAQVAVTNAAAALGGDPEIDTDKHPAVLAALVARDQAQYRLDLTEVKAPSDGLVYQATSFKPGQFVTAGAPLFTLLPVGDIWVDANFKETQLAHIVAGAPATVAFDVLSGKRFAAHVDAIGAGTGSEFSLLPAQNATGNWVKVTQRVPVRVTLDNPADAAQIVSGMSATVAVETGVTRQWTDLLPAALTGK